MRRLYHCILPLHYGTVWAWHTSSGLYKDTAFLLHCRVLVLVNLSLAFLSSKLLTACHPHSDSSKHIFTSINTEVAHLMSHQSSKLKTRDRCEKDIKVFCVTLVPVTCYSRRAAVGGKRWWWAQSCARGHRQGGKGRTRTAVCLWSGSGSGSPLSLHCFPAQSNCRGKTRSEVRAAGSWEWRNIQYGKKKQLPLKSRDISIRIREPFCNCDPSTIWVWLKEIMCWHFDIKSLRRGLKVNRMQTCHYNLTVFVHK